MLLQNLPKRRTPTSLNSLILKRAPAFQALALAWVLLLAGSISACGQQGPLVLPTEPAAANRATLTEALRPGSRAAGAAVSPPSAAPASAPLSPP